MTRAEALAEARRRWGKDGAVDGPLHEGGARFVGKGKSLRVVMEPATQRFEVGTLRILKGKRRGGAPGGVRVTEWTPKGWGPSWEAAFADADRREGGAR